MDTAATLSFFQSFYTGAALYVVPEANTPVAPEPAPEPAVAAAPAAAPPVPAAPVAAMPAAPKPGPAAPPAAAAPKTGPAALPTPPPAPEVPVLPAPVRQPTAPPVAPVAAQPLGTLPLAQLPAAAAAPAGRVQPTPTESPVAHVPFGTLGSNPHGLVLLVRLPPEQFRKLPRNVFLNNLLKALRLVMEDVVLVNVEHEKYPVALCSLRREIAARQILAFGKNLLDVAVYTTQPYEPVLLYGDTAYLGASEIDMLEYDAGRKKQLWQAVQRMFLG